MDSDLYQHQENRPKRFPIQNIIEKKGLTLKPHQDIYKAMELLNKEIESHGAPVLDEEGRLLGLLSEKDCLKHAFDAKYNSLPPGKVKDYMSTNLIVLSEETDLFDVIELFILNNYQSYPVIRDGFYKGMIKRSKILKELHKHDFLK